MLRVCIIGFGRVGSHLYYALKRAGKYKIAAIQRFKDSKDIRKNTGLINDSGIIFITTQDSNIRDVVARLSSMPIDVSGKYVYHTSGVLTSDILKPLKERGAETGSFHPVQTFEARAKGSADANRLIGICTVLEGSKRACGAGAKIAKETGSVPLIINKHDKVIHHICCVMASNYLISIIAKFEELVKKIPKIGFKKHSFFSIYEPLMRQTIENVKKKGAMKSLTGPIERNDTATIRLHLRELEKKMPEMVSFYKVLGRETLKLAKRKGSMTRKGYDELVRSFG